MADKMAILAKDTAIYGLSSIIGRFLNYLLFPIHTAFIASTTGGYGIVTHLYAYAALLFVLLTFGMETTFFRFANKDGNDGRMVYSTALRLVGGVGLVFLIVVFSFLKPIANFIGYSDHPEYIGCFAIIGALDAFQAIMFSHLRQQHRPFKFLFLKMAFIVPNVILNVFVFWIIPKMFTAMPVLQEIYVRYDNGVGLIFFVNLICTLIVTAGFAGEIKGIGFGFDKKMSLKMLSYAWPILLLGIIGILPQVFDKIIYNKLVPGDEGRIQLGLYGACVKIAMIMSLLTQAFRYAYEPLVFGASKDKDSDETMALGMKYFVIFAVLAFLAVMFYLPILKFLVADRGYWVGLKVIPIVMMGEIFMGIYFNLSFWYKLSDQTWWGAIMSSIGTLVMITINVLFVPQKGYIACAWGGFAGYAVCMLLSYFIGQQKSRVRYPLAEIGAYILLAGILYAVSRLCLSLPVWLQLTINTILILVYLAYLIKKDLPLKSIPVIGKYFK